MPGINRNTLAKGPLATEAPLPASITSFPWRGQGAGHRGFPPCLHPAHISTLRKGSQHPWIQLRTKGRSSAPPSVTPCSTESWCPGLLWEALPAVSLFLLGFPRMWGAEGEFTLCFSLCLTNCFLIQYSPGSSGSSKSCSVMIMVVLCVCKCVCVCVCVCVLQMRRRCSREINDSSA